MKLIISLAILLISFQCFDCHHGRSVSNSRLNYFDIELLRYASEGKSGNVMVSPASVKITLAMLLEGAKNATAHEIRTALRLSSNDDDRRLELLSFLNTMQINGNNTVLESGNGVFVSKKLTLKKEYEASIKRDFSSELTKVDFDDSKQASELINTWVSQKTHGLIPTIVEPESLAATSQIILTNALYFRSTWKYAFNPFKTHSDCFYRSGACQKVAVMEMETELPYAYIDDLKAQAVELPYEGGRFSMVLLVPLDHDGCEALIRDLPFKSLAQIHELMHPTDVTLSMPKFTVDFNIDMIKPLSQMHITTLFSSVSNLTGIFDGNSGSVGNFQHKVFMSVDETGTVAAAVSSAVVVPLSFSGVEINVNKPFVFFIRDNDLGTVLFEGKIEEPMAFVAPANHIKPSKPLAFAEPVMTVTVAPKAVSDGNIVFRGERSVETASEPQRKLR